jgi:hypothetical protein
MALLEDASTLALSGQSRALDNLTANAVVEEITAKLKKVENHLVLIKSLIDRDQ